jgi:hypothetical protein
MRVVSGDNIISFEEWKNILPKRRKQALNQAGTAVRKVLMELWDPIGVKDEPCARDEYDSYVPGLVVLLFRNATDETIADYLRTIQTEHMGLKVKSEEALHDVVRGLRAVFPRQNSPE